MQSLPSRSRTWPRPTCERAPQSTKHGQFVPAPPRRERRNQIRMENSMRLLRKSTVVTMSSLLVMSAVGCASTPAPKELLDARAAYQRAQSGTAAQFKPDEVHEAKVALDKAEQSFVDDPGNQKAKDLAYVAERKSELADANAANAQAQSVKGQAESDTKQTTKGQLAQTRGQLAMAGGQLGAAAQALAGSQQ